MKIATLNINSINARISNLCKWLNENQPDIVLLQEIKTEFNNFPFFDLQTIGYDAKILGQKSYNGVAILSKSKINLCYENIPNFPDNNARYIEAEISVEKKLYTVASLYLPNGNPSANNPADNSKLIYKLNWMDAFLKHADDLLTDNKNVILGGDFNVILSDFDVYNPKLFKGNALFCPEVKSRLKKLYFAGYYDVFRTLYPDDTGYTFWDYTGGALNSDFGMRIDYLFCSPSLVDKLNNCSVDRNFRRWEKASDHTILQAEFDN